LRRLEYLTKSLKEKKRGKEMNVTRPIAIDELTKIVIGLCIKIHSKIGPGCFERVYEEILFYELTK